MVAALVLPSTIAGFQKRVFVNKVKYAYAVMSNAFLMSQQEHGDPTEWDWGNDNSLENNKRVVETYILPYLSVVETSSYGAYMVVRIKNGTKFMFVLDGCTNPATCNPVTVDALRIIGSANGLIAGTNATERNYSRNDFVMNFYKTKKNLTFFNWGGDSRDAIKNNSIYACNKNIDKNKRMNCGALIFYDGWQIKDDYPW